MGFHEVRFPEHISYGSRGGPGFNTTVVMLDSGAEQRFGRWETERCEFDIGYGFRSLDDISEALTFFRARRGALYGFRYKDWLDFTSAANGRDDPDDEDQFIGTGDGSETEFQLIKTYTSGTEDYVRNIQKPVDGTVVVALDGTPEYGFTPDYATGIITFDSAPGTDVEITAGYEFDVPVRFSEEADKGLQASIDAFESGSISHIVLVELKNELPIPDNFPYRGGKMWYGFVANVAINLTDGFSHHFNTTVSALAVVLPDTADIPTGGIHFQLYNDGVNSLDIVDADGNSVLPTGVTFGQGSSVIVCLTLQSAAKTWMVI